MHLLISETEAGERVRKNNQKLIYQSPSQLNHVKSSAGRSIRPQADDCSSGTNRCIQTCLYSSWHTKSHLSCLRELCLSIVKVSSSGVPKRSSASAEHSAEGGESGKKKGEGARRRGRLTRNGKGSWRETRCEDENKRKKKKKLSRERRKKQMRERERQRHSKPSSQAGKKRMRSEVAWVQRANKHTHKTHTSCVLIPLPVEPHMHTCSTSWPTKSRRLFIDGLFKNAVAGELSIILQMYWKKNCRERERQSRAGEGREGKKEKVKKKQELIFIYM